MFYAFIAIAVLTAAVLALSYNLYHTKQSLYHCNNSRQELLWKEERRRRWEQNAQTSR